MNPEDETYPEVGDVDLGADGCCESSMCLMYSDDKFAQHLDDWKSISLGFRDFKNSSEPPRIHMGFGVLKWGYLQIIHFSGVLYMQLLGYLCFWKPPFQWGIASDL